MNRIEKQVDRIIAGLKVNEALKNVRFIREYGSDEAPSPVNGMIAVVSVRDMSTEKSYIGGYLSPSIKGESYNAGVEIRVYAPATENGSGLSEVVSEILLGLKTADAEKTITHSEAASIEFDPDMNAIYRTVSFNMEFCAMLKCEGKILGGVEKATCTRKNSFTEIKEFFNDKPVERIVSNEWELTFVMKITDKTPFLERDSFKSLELDLAKKKIIYTDCKVLEFSSVTQGSGSILATVKISAYERKII